MKKLNLPSFQTKIRNRNSKAEIFDEFRKKFVSLTPEEWVRQNFAHFMVNQKHYPKGLLAIEYSFKLHARLKRADILAFDTKGKPLLIVECKSIDVSIDQKVFDQIARYNMAFKVKYLVVTNGIDHYACKLDYETMNYQFIQEIPSFESLR